ncbi:DUF4870 domain-containing protein [Flavobacterium salilacus subsp. salilacus]|uniref:DUF4870 domain-containing protein n=1 Tax=Flavobacterium TaxID=237 RepID=UPI0010751FE0|nr:MULTISPECIES: DUF4870 domain-containing protein [Flavobacterium]KAF2519465.1 DUF4870 domain-containing protein [Flavobacterium salilacus subsp. salilacus]MBE1614639.1 DUF4870 domain-containing protein [Flavobacterium sp. SaA2.13]
MTTTTDKNIATLMQISALSQYFIPFGNLILPTLIWSLKKKDSEFIDSNGKQAINFQLSLLVYFMTLLVISVPAILYSIFDGVNLALASEQEWVMEQFTAGKITGIVVIAVVTIILLAALKVMEFFLILYAAVKNSNGEVYNYPITIKFIK